MRQERSERTRRNLVGAASTVFDQSGYERATLSAISERARVTKGALSFHFAAKADLARAVQADACAVSGAALAEIARRETPAFEIATAMTHTVVRLVESDALVRAGARLTQEIRTPDDPALHVHLNWLGALHGALRRAKADGSLLREVDVPAAASLLLSLITGTTTLPHITGRGPNPAYWGHRSSRDPGDRQHGTGARPREARDRPRETEARLREAGARPHETGASPRETRDRPRETGDQWLTRALHLIRPALSHPRTAP
ncbi:ScbR family autoregulator-binding transcription factor [Streptomyces sp. NPDC005548]|uniref:ScbR family autoregulator-binding transcription factor n=1 Tax=Streptomyces sp. NPDC005548 TaxID=3364724 RepID=UPI0036CE4A1C